MQSVAQLPAEIPGEGKRAATARLPLLTIAASATAPLPWAGSRQLKEPLYRDISNKYGGKQSYAIFAEAPQIQANSQVITAITRRIITSVHYVPSGDGQANIFLPKSWYATCGTYDVDTDSTARQVQAADKNHLKPIGSGCEVIDQREVELGTRTDAGVEVPGSTLEIECDNGTPCFVKPYTPLTRLGAIDSFAIRTRTDFIPQEAKANKYLVGFTSSVRPNIGPYASFVPLPGRLYQIMPSSTLEDTTYKVDFEKLATDHVHLVHRGDGVLTMVKTPADFDVNKSTSSSVVGSSVPGSPRLVTSSPGGGQASRL
ncbi:hypothetical protein N657DRAFT_679551 [Parathielavia appendiculata]|uniref:Uncharacterized protein n=1 Tax=Parathielavia appendiculata TaxID=2587402 RepID=A0AAN6Z4A9_9PEZI|nr:hypothetical protein N657DRAFT_679551 [Parathielavia appendiculata]